MYRCPSCWQDFLTRFEPCPGCSEQVVKQTRSRRARERRRTYDPIGQIESSEFWNLWRLYSACPCCGDAWGQKSMISLDHIIPLARGGPNNGENVQPLCQRCNLWKSIHIIYFDRAFKGQAAALPQILWPYWQPQPADPQISLMEILPNVDLRYPQATAQQLEAITTSLTQKASKGRSLECDDSRR